MSHRFPTAPALWTASAALALVVMGCDKEQPPPVPAASTSTAAATAATPTGSPPPTGAAPQAGAGLTWTAPEAWKDETEPHPMRKAWYSIGPAEGDDEPALLTVMQVGGDIESNINRWEQQFTERDGETIRRTEQLGGYKVTVVEIKGSFAGGGMMPGAAAPEPKSDQMMLAAIVETTPQPHFFKMTGPRATVEAAKADFDKMLATLK